MKEKTNKQREFKLILPWQVVRTSKVQDFLEADEQNIEASLRSKAKKTEKRKSELSIN